MVVLMGCGSGGDPPPLPAPAQPAPPNPGPNVAPELTVHTPTEILVAFRGESVEITYTDDDANDAATTELFADHDGDLSTTIDQFSIAAGRPHGGGALQTFGWDTTDADAGTYRIGGRITDGSGLTAESVASGRVTVVEVPAPRAAGGPGDDEARDVASFADGSCVLVGMGQGPLAIGALPIDRAGPTDFIARLDRGGRTAWAFPLADVAVNPTGIAAFADGSCVAVGTFTGPATFGAGGPNETVLDGGLFVARYDAAGGLLWARAATGDFPATSPQAVAASSSGDCYVAVSFRGTVVMSPGTSLAAAGDTDIGVARFDGGGTLQWARRAGGIATDASFDVACPDASSCVVVGRMGLPSTFDPGGANETSFPIGTAGPSDAFVARYASDGELSWVRAAGGPDEDTALGVAVFSDGSLAVSGSIRSGVASFGSGEANETSLPDVTRPSGFIARYASDGPLLWAHSAAHDGDGAARGVATLPDNSCVVVGSFRERATFGFGQSNETVISPEQEGIFLARVFFNGEMNYVRALGGAGDDGAVAVAGFPNSAMVLVGAFEETVSFDREEVPERALTAVQRDLCIVWYTAGNEP